jgi:fermentation-respiration switch protein FrsA (DUF1100 family)
MKPPSPNILGPIRRLAVTLPVAYVIVLLLIRFLEPHFLFFPNYPDRLGGDWNPRALERQEVWFNATDGTRLYGWWAPADNAKFTFLAFHGNAGNIADRTYLYEFLRATPANVFAVEYRGYGRSEGSPTETGLYQDADAALKYLIEVKRLERKQIIVFGQSLGTAVATHVASQNKVGGLILEAPFPSASAVAQHTFWFLPGISLLVYSQLDTEKRIKQLDAPLLVVHCEQDPVIPLQFGQKVYEAAHPPKSFVLIKSSCHEESALIAPIEYRNALQTYLQSAEKNPAVH